MIKRPLQLPIADSKREASGRSAPGSRAQVVANVFIEPNTKRIYSKHQQPLINYFAVFAETGGECPTAVKNKPVLSMLSSDARSECEEVSPIELPRRKLQSVYREPR